MIRPAPLLFAGRNTILIQRGREPLACTPDRGWAPFRMLVSVLHSLENSHHSVTGSMVVWKIIFERLGRRQSGLGLEEEECRMGRSRISGVLGARGASASIIGLAILLVAGVCSAAQNVAETGSTLIYPVFQGWVGAYAKVDPAVHMTMGATGSEAGISQAITGQVQIGTSDAYMSDTQAMANLNILNIPLAISAQLVVANLPELRGSALKLSGAVLAGIYSGKIGEWDAAPIAALNSGVHLPHRTIVPVHRADGSGDTFIFTQFLTFSTPEVGGVSPPGSWEKTIYYGTTVHWPSVADSLTASSNSNQDMAQKLASTPYAV